MGNKEGLVSLKLFTATDCSSPSLVKRKNGIFSFLCEKMTRETILNLQICRPD